MASSKDVLFDEEQENNPIERSGRKRLRNERDRKTHKSFRDKRKHRHNYE